MAKEAKVKKLTEGEADALRAQLAAHEDAMKIERRDEARKRYKDIHEFVNSDELQGILQKSRELTSQVASDTADRNLYFTLDNLRVAIEALNTVLNTRLNEEGIRPAELAKD